MPIQLIFFDLDDTLYPSSTGIWPLIGQRMDEYMRDRLHIDPLIIPKMRQHLFETYGTTMRGLQATYHLNTEDFLAYVHDVQVENYLRPDPALRWSLLSLPQRRVIFTNADRNHADRVLACLELEGLFDPIIDIHQIAPFCKPNPDAFTRALNLVGNLEPAECLFVDDSPRNLNTARQMGLVTIRVGSIDPHPAACASIASLADLPEVLANLNGGTAA